MTRDLSAGGNRRLAGHFKRLLDREMPEFALGEALMLMRLANTAGGTVDARWSSATRRVAGAAVPTKFNRRIMR